MPAQIDRTGLSHVTAIWILNTALFAASSGSSIPRLPRRNSLYPTVSPNRSGIRNHSCINMERHLREFLQTALNIARDTVNERSSHEFLGVLHFIAARRRAGLIWIRRSGRRHGGSS
jgi:hypothetical protein